VIKFLGIQHTYQGVEVALFKDSRAIQKIFEDKKRASRNIIPSIQDLLKKNNIKLQDIDFIAVNQGPGPFTTLRVVISSVNGLAFATRKPLIGIDGLDALIQEYQDNKYAVSVGLLNAFGGDVYFAIDHIDAPERKKGCRNIMVLLTQIKNYWPKVKIQFLGNGSELYREQIIGILRDQAVLTYPIMMHCSIEKIGSMALEGWKKNEDLSDQLQPLYLKAAVYKRPYAPTSF